MFEKDCSVELIGSDSACQLFSLALSKEVHFAHSNAKKIP